MSLVFTQLTRTLQSIHTDFKHSNGLDGCDSYFDSQFSQSLFQELEECSEGSKHNWYHRHFNNKVQEFVYFFALFYLLSVVRWHNKIHYMINSFFLANLLKDLISGLGWVISLHQKVTENTTRLIFKEILVFVYSIWKHC